MIAPRQAEDVRAAKPYLLSTSPLKAALRRLVSILALLAVDVVGLVMASTRRSPYALTSVTPTRSSGAFCGTRK